MSNKQRVVLLMGPLSLAAFSGAVTLGSLGASNAQAGDLLPKSCELYATAYASGATDGANRIYRFSWDGQTLLDQWEVEDYGAPINGLAARAGQPLVATTLGGVAYQIALHDDAAANNGLGSASLTFIGPQTGGFATDGGAFLGPDVIATIQQPNTNPPSAHLLNRTTSLLPVDFTTINTNAAVHEAYGKILDVAVVGGSNLPSAGAKIYGSEIRFILSGGTWIRQGYITQIEAGGSGAALVAGPLLSGTARVDFSGIAHTSSENTLLGLTESGSLFKATLSPPSPQVTLVKAHNLGISDNYKPFKGFDLAATECDHCTLYALGSDSSQRDLIRRLDLTTGNIQDTWVVNTIGETWDKRKPPLLGLGASAAGEIFAVDKAGRGFVTLNNDGTATRTAPALPGTDSGDYASTGGIHYVSSMSSVWKVEPLANGATTNTLLFSAQAVVSRILDVAKNGDHFYFVGGTSADPTVPALFRWDATDPSQPAQMIGATVLEATSQPIPLWGLAVTPIGLIGLSFQGRLYRVDESTGSLSAITSNPVFEVAGRDLAYSCSGQVPQLRGEKRSPKPSAGLR